MGEKHDEDKLRFELLDPQFIEAMASVLTKGAKKYSANSWQSVPGARQRYIGACHRHLNALQQGQEIDMDWPDQEYTYHAAQVAINAMFIWWLSRNSKEEVKI